MSYSPSSEVGAAARRDLFFSRLHRAAVTVFKWTSVGLVGLIALGVYNMRQYNKHALEFIQKHDLPADKMTSDELNDLLRKEHAGHAMQDIIAQFKAQKAEQQSSQKTQQT